MKVDRETLSLPCRLTAEEIQTKAIDLVRHEDDVVQLERDLAIIKDDFKERISGHGTEIKTLRAVIRTQSENRDVECVIVPLVSSSSVVTIRTDTNIEVSRRPMTDHEKLQPGLFDASAENPENGEVEIEDEHSHLVQAVTLADLMFQLDIDLAPGELVTLTGSQLGKARAWALKSLNLKEGEERQDPPKAITELLKSVEETRAHAAEREALENRCMGLLVEAGEKLDGVHFKDLTLEQLNEATDYAQACIERNVNEETPTLPRPTFLPALAQQTETAEAASATT